MQPHHQVLLWPNGKRS